VDADPFQRLGDEICRDHLQQVHHQDPEEQGDRDRRHQLAGPVVGVARLAVNELQADLDEGLPLARHAGGGVARGQPEQEHHQQAHQHRGHEGVHVQRPEAALAERMGQVLEVVLDVAGWGQFRLSRHGSALPVLLLPC